MEYSKIDKISTANPKGRMGIPTLLFIWFFISMIPNILMTTSMGALALMLKSPLFLSFLFIVVLFMLKTSVKVNLLEAVMAMVFCLLQITSDYFIGQDALSMASAVDTVTSTTYYFVFIAALSYETIDRKGIFKVAFLYDLFILYACAVNIIRYGSYMLSIFSATQTYEFNLRSFFLNRNMFGLFLFIGAALCMMRIIASKDKSKNLWYWFVLGVVSVNLFCTLSRTALLNTAVFVIIFLIFENKHKVRKRMAVIGVIILVMVALLFITGAHTFVSNVIIRADDGSTGRVDRWIVLLGKYREGNLLFGRGAGAINGYMPHNTYIAVLITRGAAMIVFVAALYMKVFRDVFKIIKRDRTMGVFCLSFIIVYLGINAMTETVTPLASNVTSVAFTLFTVVVPRYYHNHVMARERGEELPNIKEGDANIRV